MEEQTRVGDLRGAAATLDRILLLDPDAINAMAFQDQQKRIEDFGGVEACLSAPAFNATPTPI